jgi:hypothetical protein
MKKFFLLLIFSLIISILGKETPIDDVIVLNDQNFQEIVEKNEYILGKKLIEIIKS